MTFARNLWRDLLDKRLWPVAVALLVAIVAVPLLIGGGSSPAPAAPGAASPAAGAPQLRADNGVTQVSLSTDTPGRIIKRSGAVRDPFKAQHIIPKQTESPSSGSAGPASAPPAKAVGGSGSSPSSPSGSSGGSGSAGTPSASSGSGAPQIKHFQYSVSLRLGTHAKPKTHGDVRGVTLLPSPDFPLVTYLGIKRDGKTAVFALSAGNTVTGNGKCVPSKKNCNVIELAPGDSVLITRTAEPGKIKRYRLRVKSVKLVPVTTKKAKAGAARTHGAKAPATVDGVTR